MMRLVSKKEGQSNYKCTIRLLDDNEVFDCEFQSFQKGRYLLDYVFNHLNLVETDYFGLRFIDQQKQRHWLDATKNILRQIKNISPILFCFRVKFYPADPLKLHEEITRYYLFLQLRRDLLHGRLYCSQTDAAVLGAYIIQADMGDWQTSIEDASYVSDYKILLKQTPKIEEKISEIHKTLQGLSAATAEIYFLKKAGTVDTYGVDPYSVKDHRGVQLYLGLCHAGILTFQGSKRTHHFRWSEIQKLNYEGKMFIVHLIYMEDARTKRKHMVGFKCSSAYACRNVWRAAVEQRLFYTMDRTNKQGVVVTGGSFFSRGTRFRYQGRCEKEVMEDSASIEREQPSVQRAPLKNVGRSTSLPTTPADSDNYETVLSRVHRPLPYIDRSASLDEEVLCGAESPVPTHELYSNGSFADGVVLVAARSTRKVPTCRPLCPGGGTAEAETCVRKYLPKRRNHVKDRDNLHPRKCGAYCPESTLPPISQLEPLVEDKENKFQQSSLPDGAFIDPDEHDDLGYFERTSQTFSSSAAKTTNKNGYREISNTHKRLLRHPAIKEDDYLPPQGYCECNDLQTNDYDRDDTSSTETLGPPTEPLDAPFVQPPMRNSLTTPQLSLPIYDPDPKKEAESIRGLIPSASQTFWSTKSKRLLPNLYRFSRVFLVTLFFIVFALATLVIFIFESELSFLEAIRSSTELVLLRVQYYEPLRNFILTHIR